ncbi:MAG: DUF6787 family protein [Fodinibius sp.]|nr:DUF6787 family protein [Fodinibius sp.]
MKQALSKFIEKMKKRWGVDTFGGLLLILFIFAITGMTTLYVRQLVFDWLGFGAETPVWIELTAWVLVVFPSYQLLFLGYGFILGQFEFVWNFEKKSLRRIKSLFGQNRS